MLKFHKVIFLHTLFAARPWLIDTFDDWLQRLEGPPHKCAVIFVDNSGIDIILGIFPFARALLKRGTDVSILLQMLTLCKAYVACG